jgi:hypothetical protein
MPRITCKQCGASGWSKNPWTHRVFMDDQLEAGFSNCFKYKIIRKDGDCPEIQFTLRYLDGSDTQRTDYELVKIGMEYLKKYFGLVSIESLACNHGDKGWHVEGELEC